MKMSNKPLTLEELRGMDGKPVWVECLKPQKYTCPPVGWRILSKSISGRFGVWSGESCLVERDYGTDWAAYAAAPPRLDRSAWEPCGCCKEKRCPTCKYDDCIPIFDPCNSCVDGSGWKPVYKFCPECGRPMTDAAWEVLEKRLEINE